MVAVISTTVLAVAVIAAATVALALGHIDTTDFVALVGGFGGITGALHVGAAASNKTSGGGGA